MDIEELLMAFDARDKQERLQEQEQISTQLDKKLNSLKHKTSQIEELSYERELITNDIISYIRTDIKNSCISLFRHCSSNVLEGAHRYFYLNKDKSGCNKETLDEFRSDFEYALRVIRQQFRIQDEKVFQLTCIMNFNFDTSYDFTFEYHNPELPRVVTFTIQIPDFSAANAENYSYLLDGYSIFHNTSDCSATRIAHNLDHHKVADALHEFLKTLDTPIPV